ncbi:MAG: 2-amino-4-hydroxy-6-hydroxymethyldihydropteridine diphosphokinase [Paramuribaculum sp.]|nr:2-amino-4-hydroxy-6-hydroxymethyldihydropteridine diphosphokinase [Paramuribaculum sp.]
MCHTAYIGIGSNIGDRHAIIRRAVTAIMSSIDSAACVSDPYESPAWGYDSPNTYINICVAARTPMSPLALFEELQAIERSISPAPHRAPDGTYIDRAIDIDLIAVDDVVFDTPALTLPHPRMHLRPFVLVPMAQIASQWRHPVLGKSILDLLD